MKILVTGGCGFLGSNIAASYLDDGVEVVIIDAMYRKGTSENLRWLRERSKTDSQLSHYQIDTANREEVEAVFVRSGSFDFVCHLAGQVAMTTSLENPHKDFLTNALGTLNVLEATRKHSPEAFIAFSSTNKVYGDLKHLRYAETLTRYKLTDYPDGLDEAMQLDFASPYGCSKGAADQYVSDWYRNFGLRTVVFRHSSIYGGRQYSTIDQGWIGWFVAQALLQHAQIVKGEHPIPFTISGSGKQVRDVLHSSDLVTLYRTAYLKSEEVAGEVFNIGGGVNNSLSLLELFEVLQESLSLQVPLFFSKLERRKSDQDVFVANIAKANRLLNWSPRVTALDGIAQMVDWVANSNHFVPK
jgi:CDP-paratose 2-epimerase